MTFKEFFKKIKNKLLDEFFPEKFKCIFCGRDIPDEDNPICEDCLKTHPFNDGNKCIKCDMQIKEGNIICDHCKNNKRYFSHCYCPFNYDKVVRKSILQFKSDGAKFYARPFADYIYRRLQQENVSFDLIVPVPSHKKTIRRRGYNPAELLAKELSILSEKPYQNLLCKNVLTKKQKFLSFKDRQENLQNTMILLDKAPIKNKKVLLVDDIITTCATINTCANLLVGAKEVIACAVARKQIN